VRLRARARQPSDLFEERARQVVAAWTDSDLLVRWRTSFVSAQDLTIEPSWASPTNLKAAFGNGWVRTEAALPTASGNGIVRYAVDGTTVPVRTLGARAAYEAMVNPRSGECPPAGGPLVGLPPGHGHGRAGRSCRGADEPWRCHRPRHRPTHPPVRAGRGQQQRHLADPRAGQRHLRHRVTARVHESDAFVVVGGTALGPEPGTMCTAALRIHEVTVALASPVGVRAVIDAASGRPLLPRAAEG